MLNICVFGLWHLGCVTAACVAERFATIGLDPNGATIACLQDGEAPIFEPGLNELLRTAQTNGTLRFSNDVQEAVASCDLVWVTFDTPVNDSDEANFGYVERQITSLFPHLRDGSTVLISSQMPVGSTARIAGAYRTTHTNQDVRFAYSPENLRLGNAIEVFRSPGRIVVGIRDQRDRERLEKYLAPFCENLLWMSIESAEMTKHALNAFLATSVTFANEVAAICEGVGADAQQVEQGLKTDGRIGPRAYVRAGGPFAGGTLARDISILKTTAEQLRIATPLLGSILESNEFQKYWPLRKLQELWGLLAGRTAAILGLTYKPGTNTLRRSAAIELCRALSEAGVKIRAFDPQVKRLPDELSRQIELFDSAKEAARGSDAVVLATEWPEFRNLSAEDLISGMNTPIFLDANRFLEKTLDLTPRLRYITVGRSTEGACS